MNLSYAILVKDEIDDFRRLFDLISRRKRPDDEIVVVMDTTASKEVQKFVHENMSNKTALGYRFYEHALNGDFATHKNFLFRKCKKDYIVNLDADEFVSEEFFMYIKDVLEQYPHVDLFFLPRYNTVSGITQEHINKWGWVVQPMLIAGGAEEIHAINFPDYQGRIVRNTPTIYWENKVHEVLTGYKEFARLDYDQFTIRHYKTIDKQEKQNNFYNTL